MQASLRASFLALLLLCPCCCSTPIANKGVASEMPLPDPFSRVLRPVVPPLNGSDVVILQHLLGRAKEVCPALSVEMSGDYDKPTAAAVACFQQRYNSTDPFGIVGVDTARLILQELSHDDWKDTGSSASELGYKYKILLPVHSNRSVETNGTLLDAHNNVLLTFPVRMHGHDVNKQGQAIMGMPWPDLSDEGCPNATARQGCVGLNSFSTDGATPTGLVEVDLNSPEDIPRLYGPYPVTRFVKGLEGNAGFLIPQIRTGVLIHTGEWSNYSTWQPGRPMPNSAGCVHSYPQDVKAIWNLLVSKCGVIVRPNSNGKLPYPYKPQGIAAVFNVG